MNTSQRIKARNTAIIDYQFDLINHYLDNDIDLKKLKRNPKWCMLNIILFFGEKRLYFIDLYTKISKLWKKQN